jgi:hypothetical protein
MMRGGCRALLTSARPTKIVKTDKEITVLIAIVKVERQLFAFDLIKSIESSTQGAICAMSTLKNYVGGVI